MQLTRRADSDCLCYCTYCEQGQHNSCRKIKWDWCGDGPDPGPSRLPVIMRKRRGML